MFNSSLEIDSSTKLYALIGSPVQHSLSPLIHNTSFKTLGINAVYLAFQVDALGEALRGMRSLGVQGFNVTVPYKESVMPFLDEISDAAAIIGAVNTVVNDNGKWIGHNTDATGFLKSLEPYRKNLKNQSVLLLGSGGSSRAVLYALLKDYDVKEVFIFNRTKERALALIKEFSNLRPEVHLQFIEENEIKAQYVTWVINATSVGLNSLESMVPADLFRTGMIAYDLIYKPPETLFLHDARVSGAEVINGIPMLIEQAAAAFKLWTGQEMPTEEVRKKLSQIS